MTIKLSKDSSTNQYETIWEEDTLDRQAEAETLLDFLEKRLKELYTEAEKGAYSVNIDAQWGDGKTFFLRRFERHLRLRGHVACYINCWEDDHAEDPIVLLLLAIEEAVSSDQRFARSAEKAKRQLIRIGSTIAVDTSKQIGAHLLRKFIGINLEELINSAAKATTAEGIDRAELKIPTDIVADSFVSAAESVLRDFKRQRSDHHQFTIALQAIVQKIHSRASNDVYLFILIDELDRCRPNFALKMLERCKHLFSVYGVVFVFATNTEQLQHTVSGSYGPKFDGKKYLRRFFDRNYSFRPPELRKLIQFHLKNLAGNEDQFDTHTQDDFIAFLEKTFKSFSLSLRDIEQCLDMLWSFYTIWPYKALKIEIILLLPLIIFYHRRDYEALSYLKRMKIPPALNEQVIYEQWNSIKLNQKSATTHAQNISVYYSKLLEEILSRAGVPLIRAAEGVPDNQRWLKVIFLNELSKLYGNNVDDIEQLSVLTYYAGYVENIERLRK